jgi:hypothetical protein
MGAVPVSIMSAQDLESITSALVEVEVPVTTTTEAPTTPTAMTTACPTTETTTASTSTTSTTTTTTTAAPALGDYYYSDASSVPDPVIWLGVTNFNRARKFRWYNGILANIKFLKFGKGKHKGSKQHLFLGAYLNDDGEMRVADFTMADTNYVACEITQ